jgi:hypothetical protein
VKLRQYEQEYSLVSILAQYIPPEWKPLAQFTSTPNDKKKSFITLTLVINVIKLVSPLLVLLENKLEYLSLPSFNSRV